MTTESLELVTAFCQAWGTASLDEILDCFTDDAVYHNIPVAPVTGKDAIRATIESFSGGIDKIEFEILHIASYDNIVLTERVDVFSSADKTISLPVMGTFEVVEGKIAAWRDYFDLGAWTRQAS